MPSLAEFLGTWGFNPVAFLFAAVFSALYLLGLARLSRQGMRWPIWRTASFFLLGLGLYIWAEFGFLHVYSQQLRWAFTTRIALDLFGVPLAMLLGKPLELTRLALAPGSAKRLDRFFDSMLVRLFGNAIFAPLFALAFFMLFITPAGAVMRESIVWQHLTTVLAPILGLLMVLPMTKTASPRSTLFHTGEFFIAFVELMLDAIPGVVLSISTTVLDGAAAVTGHLPAWFPSAIDDQHFSGNLLWMIAESVDIPILIMLFIRLAHADRRDAKTVDNLSDADFEELTRAHLRGPRR